MPLPWRIKLLGELSARRGQDDPARFDTRQTAALLAYLAYFRERPHSRELLAEQLWPEEDSEATRSRLRTALWALRRVLEPDGTTPGSVLITDRAGICLAPHAFITDVADFEEAVQTAARAADDSDRALWLYRAVELYPGELLPGCYEEWIAPERARQADAFRQTLCQAAAAMAASGSLSGAIDYGRRAIAEDPLQEEAHIALISLYLRSGRMADAVRQYRELERVLQTEMGLKPSAAARELVDSMLHAERAAPGAAAATPLTTETETAGAPAAFPAPSAGAASPFLSFLRREILMKDPTPIVWGLDEVDRLFGHSYSADVFGLFRSWHNARSLDPSGPWGHLTLAIAYATEAHLFITDLNQSPFNVGTRLSLTDFTREEVVELNRRYSSPLRTEAEITRFVALVGGQPYLVRRGLHAMAEDSLNIAAFEAAAVQEDGLYSDHLRRMRLALQQDTGLCEAVRAILVDRTSPAVDAFFRLQSAGVVSGPSASDARLRCGLYQQYLERNLP